jgi:DNA-binding response OmpR family regulator
MREVSSVPKTKAIIIVEDDVEIAELIKQTLNDEPDYQAVAVHDGTRALQLMRSLKSCVVLLDVMLPDKSGFQIYDEMQQDAALQEVPVIFCTAGEHTSEFKRRNIKRIIRKPFDLDELVAQVDDVCRVT